MKMKRSAGVLAHPTAFPGKYGIGDLGQAAYDFVDFLEQSGQKLWQILPLNPTGFGNSPYQSHSAFAGNPLLISPDLLVEDGLLMEEDIPALPVFTPCEADFDQAVAIKEPLLAKAYEHFVNDLAYIEPFQQFQKNHSSWLRDFALFVSIKNALIQERKTASSLQEKELAAYAAASETKTNLTEAQEEQRNAQIIDNYFSAALNSWPEKLLYRDARALMEWETVLSREIGYQEFLQFLFDQQWQRLKTYATERNIQIIGDIPIFVALDSADVWANAHLFHLDSKRRPTVVAGVPPDYFSETGQLWGNPLYDWQAHKREDYRWWVNRIRHGLTQADIIRIDHFRGFETYWEVPADAQTAMEGKWVKGPGIALFNHIEKELGEVNIIAEDLGIITDAVRKLRDDAGLPGMVILQFAFDGGNDNAYLPHSYETSRCAVYTGTHDNDTTVGWYEKADEETKDYYRRYCNVPGTDPAWEMIRLAFASCANYAIIPLQDLMGLGGEHRMNTPGTAAGNWGFRYSQEMLSAEIRDKLLNLGRLFNR